jgi:FtsZ-interacting cell division protein ZipA
MVLPGPVKPLAALDDMIGAARALASSLNAGVFDASRQPFDENSAQALKASVKDWMKRSGVA